MPLKLRHLMSHPQVAGDTRTAQNILPKHGAKIDGLIRAAAERQSCLTGIYRP